MYGADFHSSFILRQNSENSVLLPLAAICTRVFANGHEKSIHLLTQHKHPKEGNGLTDASLLRCRSVYDAIAHNKARKQRARERKMHTQAPKKNQPKPRKRGKGVTQAAGRDADKQASEKNAISWLHTARFLTTAAELYQLPEDDTPEIAFVGRSNAGKSTCINTLCQQRQLAFASKTPGRTQHINLFTVGRGGATDCLLADLPGYGYAAVSKVDKIRWQQVMANYLVSRPQLRAVVMLCDARHGIRDLDEALLELIRPRVEDGLDFCVVLTKADKLKRTEQQKILSITRLNAGGGQAMLFSALKRTGIGSLATLIQSWGMPQQTSPATGDTAPPSRGT